jgi:hypothetical protein
MEDTLSGGRSEREPPRWQRPLVITILLVVLATGVERLTTSSHHSAQPLPAPASAPAPLSPATSPPTTTTPTAPALDGVVGTLPRGTELIVGGQHPFVLGAATQWLSRLPVSPDEALTGAFPVAGGIVAQVQNLESPGTGPGSRIYFVRRDGSWSLLTSADNVVTSFDGQRIFALTVARGEQPGTLAEIALSGKKIARHAVPAGFAVWSDSPEGLVVSSDPEPGDAYPDLRIVDPETLAARQDLGSIGYVDAASSTVVAWTPSGCSSQCSLTVANLAVGGGQHHLTQARGFTPGAMAISPDGLTLAISWVAQQPEPRTGFVEVVNLSTGARHAIPGVATAFEQAADLTWTPDGQSLGVGVELSGDVRRVGVWSLTGGPVQLLNADVTEAEDSASTLLALSSRLTSKA